MAEENTAPELESFLRDYVESYEELKALICLGTARDTWSTAESLASECRVNEETILTALERLAHVGLLARRDAPSALEFRLHDDFQTRGDLFDRLAVMYRQNSLQLIEVMTKNAIERVRASALRTFADSFRIRGSRDDG
ncbi:MAG TPA: hypothetical protein VGS22_06820 [Thermoanaerobaculia bacterium]|nr:hypothetical protein [Thermoanaerobaculia bacterium]